MTGSVKFGILGSGNHFKFALWEKRAFSRRAFCLAFGGVGGIMENKTECGDKIFGFSVTKFEFGRLTDENAGKGARIRTRRFVNGFMRPITCRSFLI